MKEGHTLFRTIHGSHLYGLNNADSDLDIYRVIPSVHRARKNDAWHLMAGNIDITTVGLSTWMRWCDESVPQALEAMFSRYTTYDEMPDFRRAYRVNQTTMRRTYRRTAKSFILSDSPKKQRHALRLLMNLGTALERGRFNPTLNDLQLVLLDDLMGDPRESYERLSRGISEL